MITRCALFMVKLLIDNKIITDTSIAVYQYGLEILISTCITFTISVICGMVFGSLPASLLYFLIFAILRSICGGYHAKTYFLCNIIFLFVTAIVMLIYKFISIEQFKNLHYCIVLLSILITYNYSPVDNTHKQLSTYQKRYFNILSIAVVILLTIISSLLIIRFSSNYGIVIDLTLFVVTVSMFVTEPTKKKGVKKCAK